MPVPDVEIDGSVHGHRRRLGHAACDLHRIRQVLPLALLPDVEDDASRRHIPDDLQRARQSPLVDERQLDLFREDAQLGSRRLDVLLVRRFGDDVDVFSRGMKLQRQPQCLHVRAADPDDGDAMTGEANGLVRNRDAGEDDRRVWK